MSTPSCRLYSAKRGWAATQFSPYATGGSFCQYKNDAKKLKTITETLQMGTCMRVLSASFPMNTT